MAPAPDNAHRGTGLGLPESALGTGAAPPAARDGPAADFQEAAAIGAALAAEARVAAGPAADGSSIEVNMTNEQLVQELLQAAGSNLKSVILYGSATAGDFVPD